MVRGASRGRPKKIPCMSCGRNISKFEDAHLHPVLMTLECTGCLEAYGNGDFSTLIGGVDEQGVDNYCRWCTDGGDLILCSIENCKNGFCRECILRNFNPEEENKAANDEDWSCYACDQTKLTNLRRKTKDFIEQLKQKSTACTKPSKKALTPSPPRSQAQTLLPPRTGKESPEVALISITPATSRPDVPPCPSTPLIHASESNSKHQKERRTQLIESEPILKNKRPCPERTPDATLQLTTNEPKIKIKPLPPRPTSRHSQVSLNSGWGIRKKSRVTTLTAKSPTQETRNNRERNSSIISQTEIHTNANTSLASDDLFLDLIDTSQNTPATETSHLSSTKIPLLDKPHVSVNQPENLSVSSPEVVVESTNSPTQQLNDNDDKSKDQSFKENDTSKEKTYQVSHKVQENSKNESKQNDIDDLKNLIEYINSDTSNQNKSSLEIRETFNRIIESKKQQKVKNQSSCMLFRRCHMPSINISVEEPVIDFSEKPPEEQTNLPPPVEKSTESSISPTLEESQKAIIQEEPEKLIENASIQPESDITYGQTTVEHDSEKLTQNDSFIPQEIPNVLLLSEKSDELMAVTPSDVVEIPAEQEIGGSLTLDASEKDIIDSNPSNGANETILSIDMLISSTLLGFPEAQQVKKRIEYIIETLQELVESFDKSGTNTNLLRKWYKDAEQEVENMQGLSKLIEHGKTVLEPNSKEPITLQLAKLREKIVSRDSMSI